jgi:hypothetical protein
MVTFREQLTIGYTPGRSPAVAWPAHRIHLFVAYGYIRV